MLKPDTCWDFVNDVEIRQIDRPVAVDHMAATDVQYVVLPISEGSLPLRCLYSPSGATTLIVTFHGSLQRTRYQLPRFEWRKTLARLNAGSLMFADTTLELSDTMPLSWFVGTEAADLAEEIAVFIRDFASDGGYSRIVLAGSSGGGFAAMAVSRRLPGSLAVSFSPQTRIGDYVPWVQRKFVETAFPNFESIDDVERSSAGRVNLRSLYSPDLVCENHVRYVQNSNDLDHVEQHFGPFADSLGIDPKVGGSTSSGRIDLLLEPMAQGHQPPSRGRFIRHLVEGHKTAFNEELKQI